MMRATQAAKIEPTIQKDATRDMAGPDLPGGAYSVARAKRGGVAAPTPVPERTRQTTSAIMFGAAVASVVGGGVKASEPN